MPDPVIQPTIPKRWSRHARAGRGTAKGNIPADELFLWIYVISLSAIAAVGAIGTYNVSRINAAKDRELQPVQSVAGSQIEATMAHATQTSARTAELAKANAEMQLELEEKVGLKPPEFLRPSDQPISSAIETDNVPRDLLSRAE